ncbi:SopA family protein, partial [Escherichia coli]|uniref:SopA family protein n=1 Tax=Escherichia coli TaxID=562 RepID=UPI001F49A4E7
SWSHYQDLDGYINNIIKMIDTLPDNAMILKSVLAVKLVMQLKILNIVNKNFIENMKKTFSHCPYIKDPIIRSYIHSGEDNKFDDFMRQHRFSKVDFDTQQMIHFINRFNMNKGLIDKNNNFFIQLIDQALRSTDDMIKANAWYLYKEWIRSDDVSPIFIETEDNLRTFNTNELTRHEMLPVNLTQETLFSSKSHGKYALFPIFTASWRAHRIMNKGVGDAAN